MTEIIEIKTWWIEDTTSHANYKNCNKESGTNGLSNPSFSNGGYDMYTKWNHLIVTDMRNNTIVRSCKLIPMSPNHQKWLNEDGRAVVKEVENTASFRAYDAKNTYFHQKDKQLNRYLITVTR